MSSLHVELFENRADESLLAKTDAGTIFLAVDYDAEELPCWAEIDELVLVRAWP